MTNDNDGVPKHLADEEEALQSELFSRPNVRLLKRDFGKADDPEKEKVAALRKQIAWCLERNVLDILKRYKVSKDEDGTISLTEESQEKLELDLRTPNELPKFQSILYYGSLLENIDLLGEVRLKYANEIPNKYILRMSSMDQLTGDISKRLYKARFPKINPNYDPWEKIIKLMVFGIIFISSVVYLWSWLDQKLF